MKKIKVTLMAFIIFINTIFTTGCWSYKEVDELSVVAGVAIDKGENYQIQMSVEVIELSSGKETKLNSKIITTEGKTMFDAARNLLALSGKKLYWGHAKVIILSKEIAREGVIKVIDWYSRGAETREDVYMLISEGYSAKEIFSEQGTTENIKSFVLDKIVRNQVSLSKIPFTDLLSFDNQLQVKGVSPVIPTVTLERINGKITPQVKGTAIFKNDKLVGFLNGEETKDLNFIRNEVKGGILVEGMQITDAHNYVSLEIFKSKTKVAPVVDDNDIKINLNIDTTVAIGEIGETENFAEDEGRKKLEQSAENTLKQRIEAFIKKIQLEYDSDIFGFGAKLREDKPRVWNSVSNNWAEVFKGLKVNVSIKVHIKNSGILSKPLEEGD